MKFNTIAVLVLVAVLAPLLFSKGHPKVEIDGKFAQVKYAKEVAAELRLRNYNDRQVRRVFYSKKEGSFFGMNIMYRSGIRYQLGTLSEKHYQQYIEQKSQGTCMASFLNQYSEMLLAIPENSIVAKQLNKISEDSAVYLSGYPVSEIISYQGEAEIPLSISGASAFLVTGVEQM